MKKIRGQFEKILLAPVHPLLFAVYYVFRLYALNVHGIPFRDLIRPLLASALAAGCCFLLYFFFVRNRHTAAFMVSATLFMFYFYSAGWELLPIPKTRGWAEAFPLIWGVLALGILLWLGRKSDAKWDVNSIFGANLMALILLLFPTLQTARYAVAVALPFTPRVSHVVDLRPPASPPDVYYVILDAYPRADVLKQYGYDNSPFLESLKDLGFYVAECSQSNYANTAPSLTSALNMDYLPELSASIRPGERDLFTLFRLLDENAVQASFSRMGYKIVSFESGFLWAEWRDADVFIAPPYGPLTDFETTMLLSTYAKTLNDWGYLDLTDIHAEQYRTRTRLALNSFDALAREPGPKFVFIHLIVPHAPFAFDENGNPADPNQLGGNRGYIAQVKFINKFLLPELKTLIEKSAQPPVIIVQGDHGPLEKDLQLRILNAYYLPNGGAEALYPGISPVNTFRVVFNAYFGAAFPLLEDVSYYPQKEVFDFSAEPNTCP